jgi:hypothetical protein
MRDPEKLAKMTKGNRPEVTGRAAAILSKSPRASQRWTPNRFTFIIL